MTLYRKELQRVLKSMIFFLAAAGIILFANTQGVFPPHSTITKPLPGAESYGTKASDNPDLIMPEAAESLFVQYSENQYITYPNGFFKYVRLNQSDREKMGEIIAALSEDAISEDMQESGDIPAANDRTLQIGEGSLQPNDDGSFQIIKSEEEILTGFHFNTAITWERFLELMVQADDLLGGGSDFSKKWMSHRFGQIPVTYDEALADYELTVSYDKLTGAHARLFSDYMGIILGLLPVFPAVFLCLSDRKNIASMLYTRRISSTRFILARFLALLTAVMLPVLIMCAVLTGIHAADYGLGNIDTLVYFKYAFFWMLPTAMASTAVGLFFTTLTNTPAAIAVQLVWWFVDTAGGSGVYSFFGVQPLQLIPRHNTLGETQTFLDYLPDLIQNRIGITLTAVLLVAFTIFVYNAKRRGILYASVFKRNKVQSAV